MSSEVAAPEASAPILATLSPAPRHVSTLATGGLMLLALPAAAPGRPYLVLVTAVGAFLAPGEVKTLCAIGGGGGGTSARVVRGGVRGGRSLEYVAAGRALGYRRWRILLAHILPNAVPPAVIFLA